MTLQPPEGVGDGGPEGWIGLQSLQGELPQQGQAFKQQFAVLRAQPHRLQVGPRLLNLGRVPGQPAQPRVEAHVLVQRVGRGVILLHSLVEGLEPLRASLAQGLDPMEHLTGLLRQFSLQ